MSKIIASISMTLDGFIAGPGISPTVPMGEGGERVHDWMFKTKTEMDIRVMDELMDDSGAVIVGGRTYNIAINDAWGGQSPFKMPAIVLIHSIPDKKIKGFTYITGSIESALREAKIQADAKNIWVMGGACLIQQFINARLIDELQINLVNMLMGNGTRLFENIDFGIVELEKQRVLDSTGVTHLKYRLIK